jgi:dolichyl-diphosphooligosaccharide--protein glycosyltransferase
MGALTCLVIYFLGKDIGGKKVGVFSAFFLSLNSSYVSRTSLGFFDDETIGIFGILLFILFFLRSIEPKGTLRTNLFYSVAAGLSLGYLFASWGAARYAVGIAVLFVFILILMRRHSSRLLLSYSTTFGIALFIAVNVPYLGYGFLLDASVLPVAGILSILLVIQINRYLKTPMKKLVFVSSFLLLATASLLILFSFGYVRPLETKFWSVLFPSDRPPLVESVGEHGYPAWGTFYLDLGIGIFFIPLGFFFALRNPTYKNLFLTIFGLTSIYFASSMVRLILIMAPAICLLWALGLVRLIRNFIPFLTVPPPVTRRKRRLESYGRKEFGGIFMIIIFFLLMLYFVFPAQLVPYPSTLNRAYSPTTVAAAGLVIKSEEIVSDWIEALQWMRENLPQNAIVASWWDYGYWITTVSNKTTLADNATFNWTQIQQIALMFLSNETEAVKILKKYNADYVVVFASFDTNGRYANIGGDDGKWMWMARISEPLTGLNDTGYRQYELDPETGALRDVGWNELGLNSVIYKLMTYGKDTKLYGASSVVSLENFKLVYYSKGSPVGNAYYALVCVYEIIYDE